jgi:hypothetical protein
MSLKLLAVGSAYSSFGEFKEDFEAYAVAKHITINVEKSDRQRYVAHCRGYDHESRCPLYIRSILSKKTNEVLVTKFEEIHSCPPHLHQKRPVAAKSRWLTKNTKSAITADQNVKPGTLQRSIQLEHSERVNYMAAWRAREIVRCYGCS